MNNLIITLLFIAALCLLPSWLAGCLALGGAIGLFVAGRIEKHRVEPKAAPRLPENVVSISKARR